MGSRRAASSGFGLNAVFTLPIWAPIGAPVKQRSNLWLVFLCLTVAAVAATITATLLEVDLGSFRVGYLLIGIGTCTLLLFLTCVLALREHSRRAKAAFQRKEREAARIRRYEQEVTRAHHEAAAVEMARKRRDASLVNRTVAELIERERMSEPTYQLPPPIVYTRATIEAARAVPSGAARRAQLLRDWLDDTGEIPWPRLDDYRAARQDPM